MRPLRAARRARAAWLLFALCLLLPLAATADRSADVIAQAREASSDGRRDEGIALLEAHLATSPRDVDARLVYGLMLSWGARYDEARQELQQVLDQAPGYAEARVALMNVEWWSGRDAEARAHARAILSEEVGNPEARRVNERLTTRPWSVKTSYTLDWFDGDRDPWHENALSVGRETPYGSIILRSSHAERFDTSDELIELETYPSFRPGTYGYLAVGAGTRHELYPRWRLGTDLYQSLGWGFEASLGYRRLQFSDGTDIYVGTLTKYLGSWMLTGRVNYVPDGGSRDSTSYYAILRRYFGEAGTSYVGLSYGHGLSRAEVRNTGDLTQLDSDSLGLELDWALYGQLRLGLGVSSSREERAGADALWQHSFSTSLGVRF